MKISPNFIPHEEFHKGIWLLSDEFPDWYYFMRKPNSNRIKNNDFIETVDKPLRDLVQFLHDKGLRTTPSCSGHHKSEKDYAKTYDTLLKEQQQIRNTGVKFKDVETGKACWYRNKYYRLPWDRDTFLEKVVIYQQKGVLGMRLKDGKARENILRLNIPGIEVKESDGVILLLTDEEDREKNWALWKEATDTIKAILT